MGKAFAGVKFEAVRGGVSSDAVECKDKAAPNESNHWDFFVSRDASGQLTAQFIILDGRLMLSKSWIPLGTMSWPFPSAKVETFSFGKLVSVIDPGIGVTILQQPSSDNSGVKSYVGTLMQSFQMPSTEFQCK